MRIAYLTQSYPPMISGAAIVVEKLATAMAERGHEVLVIAASDRDHPYRVQQGPLTILRLKSIHNPLRVNQRFLLFSYFAILKALKEFQPDIIHAHEPLQPAWAGITYARLNQISITLTAHQVPALVTSYLPNIAALRAGVASALWFYTNSLARQFQTVIAPSQTTAGLIAAMTSTRPITISNGIDLQTFHPPLTSDDESATRQKWNLPLRVPLLLHVGRLDPEKHVDRLLKACVPILQKTPAQLFIVGDGCEKENLIRLSHALGIAERVHFAGFVSPQNGLPEIYRMADLFLTASESETQGIVLLEAAASGLPILAANATCIPELVHDRVNGYLVNFCDSVAVQEKLNTLTADLTTARAMGRAGRSLAEGHSIHASWLLHEKLYRDLSLRNQHTVTHHKRERLLQWRSLKTFIGLK